MLRIARRALLAANDRIGPDLRLQVLVNNSDGFSHSYGSHLSVLITRAAWDRLFHHRLPQLLMLAAYQASSIVFTGQGKVGSENGSAPARYQIAQRADFFEQIVAAQTTYARPIVNSRDESLCGPRAWEGSARARDRMARLHCIFYDNTLCPVATLLKGGVLQIVLAMLEADWLDLGLVLDSAVQAVHVWSHDPDLRATARLLSGRRRTAVELQLDFLDAARRFVDAGGAEGIVPRAREILELWQDTVACLEARDHDALARKLDWVLKRRILTDVLDRRPDLDWDSPELKILDHLYADLDLEEDLYWAHERAGLVDAVVPEAAVEHFTHEPPDDTRAWTRAMLLRAAGGARIEAVDWDRVRIHSPTDAPGGPRAIEMSDPTSFTRAHTEGIFRSSSCLEEILGRLRPSTDARPAHDPSRAVGGPALEPARAINGKGEM